MLTRANRVAAAVATTVYAVFAGWQLLGWGGVDATRIAGSIGAALASSFAFAGAVRAARGAADRQRAAWACLAVGLTGWMVTDIYRVCSVIADPARPLMSSVVEIGHLLLPVGAAGAAVLVPMARGHSGLRLLLDGVIIATALYLVGWMLVLRGIVANASSPAFVLMLASVVADIGMIAIALMAASKSRNGIRLSPALLTVALTVLGIADALHLFGDARSVDNTGLLVGWTSAMYLVGLSALSSRPTPAVRSRYTPQPSRLSLWLPYAPMPFAVILGAIGLWPGGNFNGYILFPGLVLVFAALIRQFTLLDENRRLLATVAGIAWRDPLTGLASRTLFTDRLQDAMHARHVSDRPVAVLVLDIDDFKYVNDGMGHPAGDEMLRIVGERIRLSAGAGDTVARIGGDEFAILIEDMPEAAADVAEQIVEAFDEPVVVEGRPLYMRVSLGMATASTPEDCDVSADELLRRADLAMYSAKRSNTGGVRAFASTMRHEPMELHLFRRPGQDRIDGVTARMRLLAELRRAIDERQLQLVYQPKFSLSTGAVVGVEALLRWPHPRFGVLEPDDFLPLIREHGLIDPVMNLVLSLALADAAGWYEAGLKVPVAVNLSTPSLNDESLSDRVESALAERKLAAEALTIEITEDSLLASVVRARSVLDRLRRMGVRVAIDDFGSGFATMTYLRDLPIDELKLDRQFVGPILHDDRSAMIVRSVIELADALGIVSVAEGVENAETADRLREYGCQVAQGHYFSPPVPARVIRLGIWGAPTMTDSSPAGPSAP